MGIPDQANLVEPRPTFVSHLECSLTGQRLPADRLAGLSPAGRPLLVRYDLAALGGSVSRDALATRPSDLWRYRELLPVRRTENIVSLGEPVTPMVATPTLGPSVWIKDEGRLPTGSFKARGLCLAVSMARELGVRRIAMPTNGNAGAALAAYAARAGIEVFVFCPRDTPEINVRETAMLGATVELVDGFITDCGRIVRERTEEMAWFDCSTLREPYRIEGKKTMGLELAEQFGWELPDAIFYPTGGGTGLIGMWKAFEELEAIGWLSAGIRRPRMIAVQSEECAPIVRAFDRGDEFAEPWDDPEAFTVAAGIRVPAAVGDFLILRAVRESGGWAAAVSETAILEARRTVARTEGIILCPEGAATVAAYQGALEAGRIDPSDRVVLFNCASGLKYPLEAPESSAG